MNILMLLDAVRPERSEHLAAVLEEVDRDPAGNAYLRFADSPHTHFVRLVLLGEQPFQRLLLAANYDGALLDYLGELQRAAPDLDAVLGACERYEDGQHLVDFVRAAWCRPRGVYVAFPRMTATQIRQTVALRAGIEELADRVDGSLATLSGVLTGMSELPTGSSRTVRLARRIDGALGRGATALQRRERNLLLPLAASFAKQGQAREFPKVFPEVGSASQGDPTRAQAIQTADVGSSMVQNQMTTLTTVVPHRLARTQLALAATRLLSIWSWPPGEFAGVGTLHWFAWALVDPVPGDPALDAQPGKQLIFLSVFDGSWKNYMQDFIDKLVWGLDGLYGNTYDYPAAGMKDTNAFTRYIIDHQWPPQVFYSAYPTETVMNLIRDRAIASGLPTGADAASASRWLELL